MRRTASSSLSRKNKAIPRRQFPGKTALAALCSGAFLLLLLFDPSPALEGARRGLALCGETVIPSLFPFLVLSAFIINCGLAERLGRLMEPLTRLLFRLPGSAGTALILGAVGGYPVGANAVAELREKGLLTQPDSERLLCFCINSSPAFIVGAVGSGLLHNVTAGILLCAAHLAASFAVGIVLRFTARAPSRPEAAHTPPEAALTAKAGGGIAETFVGSVTGSIRSVLSIVAFVVLFSSLNSLLADLGLPALLSNFFSAFLPFPAGDPLFYQRAASGILEVTNGCAAAAGGSGLAALLLLALMLGWSGISVQLQVVSMVQHTGISTRPFFFTRFLHMFFSSVFALMLFSLFPKAIPTFAPATQVFAWNPYGITAAVHPVPAVCAMLLVCAALLLSLAQV